MYWVGLARKFSWGHSLSSLLFCVIHEVHLMHGVAPSVEILQSEGEMLDKEPVIKAASAENSDISDVSRLKSSMPPPSILKPGVQRAANCLVQLDFLLSTPVWGFSTSQELRTTRHDAGRLRHEPSSSSGPSATLIVKNQSPGCALSQNWRLEMVGSLGQWDGPLTRDMWDLGRTCHLDG